MFASFPGQMPSKELRFIMFICRKKYEGEIPTNLRVKYVPICLQIGLILVCLVYYIEDVSFPKDPICLSTK